MIALKRSSSCHYLLVSMVTAMLTVFSQAFAALYSSGHADIGIAYENGGAGGFEPHWQLGSDAVVDGSPVGNHPDGAEFMPDEITVAVPFSQMIAMPNSPALIAGTGVAAGDAIWFLPESEIADAPFLGIATNKLDSAKWGNITFALGTVTSPSGNGNFSLWNSGPFGSPNFYFSTALGEDTLILPTGTHAHFDWSFSEAGTWDVELTVSGTHVDDGFQSVTETISFVVIPEPSSALVCALSTLVVMLRRRRV